MHARAGDKRKSMRAGGVLWEGMGLGKDLARLRLVRGLSNDSGLNNCFLNVVIQALWHLRTFRTALLALEPKARCCPAAFPLHVSQPRPVWPVGLLWTTSCA